jgi:serine protease
MKLTGFLALLTTILSLIVTPPAGAFSDVSNSPSVSSPQSFYVDQMPVRQLIVKYRKGAVTRGPVSGVEQMQLLSASSGVTLDYLRPMSGDAHVLRLAQALPVGQAEQVATQLAALPEVEYAEPDYWAYPDDLFQAPSALTTNDTYYNNQWHYFAPGSGHYGVNAPGAWDITTGSSSVYVAVIDTGILDHVDLANRWTGGYDFIVDTAVSNDGNGRDNDPHDPGDWTAAGDCGIGWPGYNSSWHGTHVAGTIAALSNNGQGVAGLNWVSKVIPVRVLGKCGGYTSDIVDGIRWAAGLSVSGVPNNPYPVKVMNLSLSGSGSCTSTYQNAINDAVNAGAVVVTAAGNNNTDASGYHPANCNNVITVAATNRNGSRAYYSNYGSLVEISAPGGETNSVSANGVLSTLNTGTSSPASDTYAYYQGTSMAAPHVTGVASLLFSYNPSLTPAQLLQALQNNVTGFPSGSTCNTSICGSGIVNAGQALASLQPQLPIRAYIPYISYNGVAVEPGTIGNGDFEAGATVWSEYSSHGWNIILSGGSLPSGVTPHGGTYAAWLGGGDSEVSYIQQQVDVPSSTPYLEYYHWISSTDYCGYDYASVRINGGIVQSYDLCSSQATGGWVRHTVNLSAYAGQSVTLQIRAETDTSLSSSLYVDDVTYSSSP